MGWRSYPLVLASADTLKQNGHILWDGHLSRQACQALVNQALWHAHKPRLWVSCRGPVHALVLAMKRLG